MIWKKSCKDGTQTYPIYVLDAENILILLLMMIIFNENLAEMQDFEALAPDEPNHVENINSGALNDPFSYGEVNR